MREERHQDIIITAVDVEKLRKYCKGCAYFQPHKPARDICSMIGWYRKDNIKEILGYVKRCPCNQKCLVKASCRDVNCPIWVKYMGEASQERNRKALEVVECIKRKISPVTDA